MMHSSIVFARWRQCALSWAHIGATSRIWLNLCFLGPNQVHNPKRQIDQFSRFCTAHGRKSLYFTMGAPFPQNCPFPWGSLIHESNTWFPGRTTVLNPNHNLIGSAVFAQMTVECPYTLQWDSPSSLKLPLPTGRCGLPLTVVHWAHPSPQPKQHLNRFSRFCMAR